MRPVSDRFLRALRGSHRAVTQALVVQAGQTGINPTGTALEVLDGNVELDATADIRSTLDITVNGRGLFPRRPTDLLAPYGKYEIFVRRGIDLGNGSIEWVSLGYFRPNSIEQDETDGPIRISGQDRMGGIVKARLTKPEQIKYQTTYGAVFEKFVGEVYPSAVIEWDDMDPASTKPAGYYDIINENWVVEEDRYFLLADTVGGGQGKIWYWDHRGVLVIKDTPDPGSPVWEVNEGQDGVLVSLAREISDEGVYNGIVVTGESLNDSPAPWGLAYDNDPQSPTYWFGPFGKVPKFYNSQFITTTAGAQSAAVSMLGDLKVGVPYQVDFQSIVNPALEPYDPILIRHGNQTETHILSRLTIPLTSAGSMQAETREKNSLIVGEG
jgi:Domain of unknown function (DUF5047)